MALCSSTGLVVKNTFLDGEPDGQTGLSPRGSKSCVARLASMSSPHLCLKKLLEEASDADGTTTCTDVEDVESIGSGDIDQKTEVDDKTYCHQSDQIAAEPLQLALAPLLTDTLQHQVGTEMFSSQAPQPEGFYLPASCTPLGPLLSPGSQHHGITTADGQPACQPCAWYYKTAGCANGGACLFCHLCPPGELKNRKRQKIGRMRAA